MITIFVEDDKTISQNSYDSLINSLKFNTLTCLCGRTGSLTRHAYYRRTVKVNSEKVALRFLRLRCNTCGSTHTVIPSTIIPYSQITFQDQYQIVINYESTQSNISVMENNLLIDENTIGAIIRQYKRHWKKRLISKNVLLTENLTKRCFQHFSLHFMQNKQTSNILFLKPT